MVKFVLIRVNRFAHGKKKRVNTLKAALVFFNNYILQCCIHLL